MEMGHTLSCHEKLFQYYKMQSFSFRLKYTVITIGKTSNSVVFCSGKTRNVWNGHKTGTYGKNENSIKC